MPPTSETPVPPTEPAPAIACPFCAIAANIVEQEGAHTTTPDMIKGVLMSVFIDEAYFRSMTDDRFCEECLRNIRAGRAALAAMVATDERAVVVR